MRIFHIKKQLFIFCFLFFSCGLIAQDVILPYKDKSISIENRIEDLLNRLTLEEKVQLMQDASKGIDRLGIKPYNWWNEALHGVARSGLATVFPQPIGMCLH